jgi:membrane associated rhomboid family serine protease
VVKKLLIVLSVCYVFDLLLARFAGFSLSNLLALSPGQPWAWQLLTFVLVSRGDPIRFLIDLLFVWWALSPFEVAYGSKRTLQLCLAAMLAAAIPVDLIGVLVPSPALVGSNVLVFGGLAASIWPRRSEQTSLFGLISMTGRQVLLLLAGISVLMYLAYADHTQLIADLGAMAGGIGFVRWIKRPRTPKVSRRPAPKARSFKVIQGGGSEDDRPKWLN